MEKIDKKGQGAMEYLLTYGWAIMVVMIVGVVLWQTGFFPTQQTKDYQFSVPVTCSGNGWDGYVCEGGTEKCATAFYRQHPEHRNKSIGFRMKKINNKGRSVTEYLLGG